MEKIIIPSTWSFDVPITRMVKYSSRGLAFSDYKVLVKEAGENTADWLRGIQIQQDQIPLHVIAMGATEAYGPNRNGDGFKEAALRKYYDTFVKYAQHYRHHKNKDPKVRYGQVKAAFYNEQMRRVELLTLLNATEKAAEKYGGFVADKELEMIEQGKDIPVSMACKIAYDVCSGCGNKAKSRADYCTAKSCKYGGCRDNLTKVASDGHLLHVDNPHPTFFDISTVIKPADRIAYGNVADYLQKAAGCETLGGAALAEAYNIVAPLSVVLGSIDNPKVAKQVKLAYALAEIEDTIENSQTNNDYCNIARAVDPSQNPVVDLSPMGTVGTTKFATGLTALAGENIALSLQDFLKLVVGNSDKLAEYAASVPDLLPGVYSRMISTGALEHEIKSNPFNSYQGSPSATQRDWASKLASALSLQASRLRDRSVLSSLRDTAEPTFKRSSVKTAAATGDAENLARSYALYKLAFLAHNDCVGTQHFDKLTHIAVVLQNYTS